MTRIYLCLKNIFFHLQIIPPKINGTRIFKEYETCRLSEKWHNLEMSVNGNRINYWLIECVLFNVPPKHISFVRRRRHYRVKGGTILALARRFRSLSRGGSRLFEQWWILIIWVRMDFDHLSRGGSWSFEQGWILIILIEQGWIFIVPKLSVTGSLAFLHSRT